MAHSHGKAVATDKNIYGRAASGSKTEGKKEGHMEVFYRKRMDSLAKKTAEETQELGVQAAKAARVAHRAKNEAYMLQKEARRCGVRTSGSVKRTARMWRPT